MAWLSYDNKTYQSHVGGWTRGAAVDFDEWAAVVGDDRYSYEGQLPWLKKAEHWFDQKNPDQHGQDGPIRITSAHSMNRHFPLGKHIVQAWKEMGVPVLPDLDHNTGNNLGVASLFEARDDGKRQWSAGLYPLEGVEILLDTLVHRVVMEQEGKSLRATGVQLADNSIMSGRNIILSAGAIRSPQLLQLSGIGPAEGLEKFGINVKMDSPEVGRNMADHILMLQHWRLRDASAGYALGSSNPLFEQPQYRKGNPVEYIVCTSAPNDELAIEIAKDEGAPPDHSKHRLLAMPRTFLEHILIHAKLPFPGVPMDTEHLTTGIINLLPTSRGSVHLTSSNPEDEPSSESITPPSICLIQLTQNSPARLLEYQRGQTHRA
jgi:choline dehydrogenase-like flavoprotein